MPQNFFQIEAVSEGVVGSSRICAWREGSWDMLKWEEKIKNKTKKKRTSSKMTMINGGLTHGDIVLFCHLQREGKVGPFCILHGVHDVLETQFFEFG